MKLGACAAVLTAVPQRVWAASETSRALSFYNTHTREAVELTYSAHGQYIPSALDALNHFLRDYRTGTTHQIAPQLFDQLHVLQQRVGTPGAYHVISGYRSQQTNNTLHEHSNGVASHSLHMQGQAIDIRLPGHDLAQLHKAALSMQAGGVGYYPQSDFIHLDVGHVRHWG